MRFKLESQGETSLEESTRPIAQYFNPNEEDLDDGDYTQEQERQEGTRKRRS